MRRLVLLILALATFLPTLAQAYDVLVLQSRRDSGSEEVLKGFHGAAAATKRVIVLADYADVDVVRIVREERPRVILAVGDAALTAARSVPQIPVVAVLALGINTVRNTSGALSGISMFAAPERYTALFNSMKVRRIGVVHNPAKSGWYVKQARQAAAAVGIELVTREITSPREALDKLTSLGGAVDALWMLPDTTAVTRETSEAYFRFGQQHAVPVVSFAANYLGLGAAAVLEIDRGALGRQAGGMVKEVLSGTRPATIHAPHGTAVRTNPAVLKLLGSFVAD
jgi:putative ABC transport system substrate-binding protein